MTETATAPSVVDLLHRQQLDDEPGFIGYGFLLAAGISAVPQTADDLAAQVTFLEQAINDIQWRLARGGSERLQGQLDMLAPLLTSRSAQHSRRQIADSLSPAQVAALRFLANHQTANHLAIATIARAPLSAKVVVRFMDQMEIDGLVLRHPQGPDDDTRSWSIQHPLADQILKLLPEEKKLWRLKPMSP